jgi:hypothetical protein
VALRTVSGSLSWKRTSYMLPVFVPYATMGWASGRVAMRYVAFVSVLDSQGSLSTGVGTHQQWEHTQRWHLIVLKNIYEDAGGCAGRSFEAHPAHCTYHLRCLSRQN